MKTMAERFIQLYHQWEETNPNDPTYGELSHYLHAQNAIGAGDEQISFVQFWNVRPCFERDNMPMLFSGSKYAVLEFHDGSYAFSPADSTQLYPYRRRWLAGRPTIADERRTQ